MLPASSINIKDRARVLHTNLSPIERIVWFHLRNRKLARFKFRRQYRIGPYIVDFICLERRLVIEIDGPTHGLPDQMRKYPLREQYLKNLGVRVVRYTNEQVLTDLKGILEDIARNLDDLPSPRPSPSRERG